VLTQATHLTSTVEPPYCPGMDRRRFLLTSLAGALAAPLAAEAQSAGKAWRVGFVGAETLSTNRHSLDAFRLGMREQG
jgi:hypothetical protein